MSRKNLLFKLGPRTIVVAIAWLATCIQNLTGGGDKDMAIANTIVIVRMNTFLFHMWSYVNHM